MKRLLFASALVLVLGCHKDSDTGAKAQASQASKGSSNVATRIVKHLEQAQPDIDFRIVDDSTIEYTGRGDSEATGKMNLDNLLLKCEQDEANCDENIEGFAKGLLETFDAEEETVSKEDIRAVLKDEVYLKGVAEAFADAPAEMRESNAIVTRPFVGELSVVYVVDSENSMRLVGHGVVEELATTETELHRIAMENMATAFAGPLPSEQLHKDSTIHSITLEDSYAAARLLLTPQWVKVAAQFSGEVIAAVPARDMLLYCDSAAPEDVVIMAEMAAQMESELPYPLSAKLFRFTGTTWELVKR